MKTKTDLACDTAEEFTKLYYESVDKRRHLMSRYCLDTGEWNCTKRYNTEVFWRTSSNRSHSHFFGLPACSLCGCKQSVDILDSYLWICEIPRKDITAIPAELYDHSSGRKVENSERLFPPAGSSCVVTGMLHTFTDKMLYTKVLIDLTYENLKKKSRWGRDFPPVHTGPGAHPVSCKMGTGSFPGVKCGRGVLLTTHSLLVPQSWKSRAIPLPTLWTIPGL